MVPAGKPAGIPVPAAIVALVVRTSPVVTPYASAPLLPIRRFPAGIRALPIVVTMLCSESSDMPAIWVPPVVDISMNVPGGRVDHVCDVATAVNKQKATKVRVDITTTPKMKRGRERPALRPHNATGLRVLV